MVVCKKSPVCGDVAAGMVGSKAEIAQRGMIVRPPPQRPMIFAPAHRDRQIVDAGVAGAHEALLVELPILVAIAAEPMAAVVVPFIGKAHGYAIFAEGPDFLDQPVVEFAIPLALARISNCSIARWRRTLSTILPWSGS